MSAQPSKPRVLYITDQAESIDIFRCHFQDSFTIFTATDTSNGRLLLQQNDTQIIVFDQSTDNKTDWGFLSEVAKQHPLKMRILVSPENNTDELLRAFNDGDIYRFIHKPWNIIELQVAMQNAFKAYNLKKENSDLLLLLEETNKLLNSNIPPTSQVRVSTKSTNKLPSLSNEPETFLNKRAEELDKANEKLRSINIELDRNNQKLQISNRILEKAIVQRKKAETSLKESEAKFRSFVEQSADGICIANPDAKVVEWNQGMVQITTIAKELAKDAPLKNLIHNLLNINSKQIITEPNKARIVNFINGTAKDHKLDFETEIYTPSGEKRHVNLTALTIHLDEGNYTGFVFRDITERKQAENKLQENALYLKMLNEELNATNEELYVKNDEFLKLNNELNEYREQLEELVQKRTKALHESEKRLRTISDNLPGGALLRLISHPTNGLSISYIGAQIEHIIGLKPEEITANDSSFWDRILAGIGEEIKNQLVHIATDYFEMSFSFKHIDGKTIWLQMKAKIQSNQTDNNEKYWDGLIMDITERKAAEHKIKEYISFQETLLDTIPTPVFYKDNTGRYLGCNKAFVNYTGMTQESIKGKTADDLFEPSLALLFWQADKELIDGAENLKYDAQMPFIDGSIRDVQLHKAMHKDSDGNRIGIIGAMFDITERKAYENALKDSENRYRFLFESTGLPIVIYDHTGKIILINRIAAQSWGEENPEDLAGKMLSEIQALELVTDYQERIDQVLETLEPNHAEECIHGAKGVAWYYTSIYPLTNDSGSSKSVMVISHNITTSKQAEQKLRESERRFRSILEKFPLPVFLKDANSVYVFGNEYFLRLLGLKNQQELLGRNEFDFYSRDVAATFVQEDKDIMRTGNTSVYEESYTFKDEKRWSITSKMPYRDSDDQIIGVLGAALDITERKQIERNILTAIVDTEERERRRFAEDLHDGLGPLLSSIKMYVRFLEDKQDEEQRKEVIENLFEVIDEAVRSVKEISNLLSPHILDDFGLITALRSFSEKLSTTLNIEFVFQTDSFTKVINKALETVLYRVFTELINNTVKYANASKIEISFSQNNDNLTLVYADNGVGFDVEKTLSGTERGLGLFNIRNRIQSFNGTFEITSRIGFGTKAQIILKI